jgi:glycosyltransferase involved in cell wall biosynthesis
LIEEANAVKKRFGASLVSTYNKQCGIATYTENLYRAIRDEKVPSCVISDDTRNRHEKSSEGGVIQCWSTARDDSYPHIVKAAIKQKNSVVHIQHEYGLFPNHDLFRQMIILLKKCGFKVAMTMHTVLTERHLDYILEPIDVLILHSEWAAQALHGRGITNTTVIPHGTEEAKKFTRQESMAFIEEMTGWQLGEDDLLGTSVGFISKNKLQKETLEAAQIACEREPKLKFLLVGSTGRRSYDIDYLPKLKEMENDQIKVVQKFLTTDEVAKVLVASDFCAMGYEQTAYSTSGAAHLAMTYGVPTISSNARILEDLTPGMSLKVAWADAEAVANAMVTLCNDSDLREQLSANALNYGWETLWKQVVKTHINVYRAIAEE